jgi:hypothetical protein
VRNLSRNKTKNKNETVYADFLRNLTSNEAKNLGKVLCGSDLDAISEKELLRVLIKGVNTLIATLKDKN